MKKIRMFALAALLACSTAVFLIGCKDDLSKPVDNQSNESINVDDGDNSDIVDKGKQLEPEKNAKPLTINEYSLGIYPYYKDVMTTYSCRKINKNMVIDGENVIVKDVMKLTVGFTNSGTLPLAYLWSPKPPINVNIDGVNDISGYSTEVESTYNVMYIMPGESITYDFLFKPEDNDRVLYHGESSVTFMPISDSSIIDNVDYDLNDIFMPVLGAKNYTNYMVHSSQQFQIDIQSCDITFIEEEPAETSVDRIRHDYYSVSSSVMDMIRSNGYSFNNVTPVYGLRYNLLHDDGAQDFIDDIDANISICSNLQHSKNEYFALLEGKSVLYVPDINRLTHVSKDGGKTYDPNLDSEDMISILKHSRLDLEDTTAKFVRTEGYIDFILLSDGNYEYIKAIKSYPQFGISEIRLYTPKEIAQNILLNADKLKVAPEKEISDEVEAGLIKCVNDSISMYKEDERDEKVFVNPPEGIEFPQVVDASNLSFDINMESERAVVSFPLYSGEDLYTMLVIVGKSLSTPEIEAVTFIQGETVSINSLPIYDEDKLLGSINGLVERYKNDPPGSKYYDSLPKGVKFRKILSLKKADIKIDDNDIRRATVTIPLNEKNSVFVKIRVRDISDICKVVGVRFITK